jgi:hypothetical protein
METLLPRDMRFDRLRLRFVERLSQEELAARAIPPPFFEIERSGEVFDESILLCGVRGSD